MGGKQAEAPTPFCWEVVTAPHPPVDLLDSARSSSSETLGGHGGGRNIPNGPSIQDISGADHAREKKDSSQRSPKAPSCPGQGPLDHVTCPVEGGPHHRGHMPGPTESGPVVKNAYHRPERKDTCSLEQSLSPPGVWKPAPRLAQQSYLPFHPDTGLSVLAIVVSMWDQDSRALSLM